MTNIFAIATRRKLRFPIAGLISVEDVWDLPLKSKREGGADLNTLATTLQDAVDKLPRRSFVDDEAVTADNSEEALKLEIVIQIIEIKKAEAKAKETAAVTAGQVRQLDDLIARKQNEALEGKSIEELQAMRAALK